MTTALALYSPPAAIARARAARGYTSLALDAHFAAMERRARMQPVVAIVEPAPKPIKRRPLVLPPPAWALMRLSGGAFVEAHAILDGMTTYEPLVIARPDMIIKREVCREWKGVSVDDLLGDRRFVTIAVPRQVAMWLEHEATGHSLPDIGRRCGRRDHTTVLHGVRAIAGRMAADPAFKARVELVHERVEIALCEHEGAVAGRMREGR